MIDPKQDTFTDVQSLLWHHVWRFVGRYGNRYGTPDDLFSELCETFVRAYDLFDPEQGKEFSTYLVCKIQLKLSNIVRLAAGGYSRTPRPNWEALREIDRSDPRSNRWESLLADLSSDARAIVRLVVNVPDDVETIIKRTPKEIRPSLWSYLSRIGWSENRIGTALKEIRESL